MAIFAHHMDLGQPKVINVASGSFNGQRIYSKQFSFKVPTLLVVVQSDIKAVIGLIPPKRGGLLFLLVVLSSLPRLIDLYGMIA